MPKLASEEFVKYLKQFDIVCLTETVLIGCVQMNSLSDFMTFSEQAKNKQTNKTNKNLKQKSTHPHTPTRTNAKQGRPSGGTKVLIRKPIADSFHNITIRYGNMLAFNVPRKKKKKSVRHKQTWSCYVVYLPPMCIPAYSFNDYNDGSDMLMCAGHTWDENWCLYTYKTLILDPVQRMQYSFKVTGTTRPMFRSRDFQMTKWQMLLELCFWISAVLVNVQFLMAWLTFDYDWNSACLTPKH